MIDDFEYQEQIINSIEPTDEANVVVHYDRACENRNRKDGLVCFVFGDKTKCFKPEEVEINEANMAITLSLKDALKRGFE